MTRNPVRARDFLALIATCLDELTGIVANLDGLAVEAKRHHHGFIRLLGAGVCVVPLLLEAGQSLGLMMLVGLDVGAGGRAVTKECARMQFSGAGQANRIPR